MSQLKKLFIPFYEVYPLKLQWFNLNDNPGYRCDLVVESWVESSNALGSVPSAVRIQTITLILIFLHFNTENYHRMNNSPGKYCSESQLLLIAYFVVIGGVSSIITVHKPRALWIRGKSASDSLNQTPNPGLQASLSCSELVLPTWVAGRTRWTWPL